MLNRFEYAGKNDKKITNYQFWQEGNDVQEIFLNDYFNQKQKSIHDNLVKAEIVNRAEDYTYSSAIDWVLILSAILLWVFIIVNNYLCIT